MSKEQIYQTLLEHCEQHHLEGSWGRFQGDLDLWEPPCDGVTTMECLQEEYADHDLIASGVAVVGKDEWLLLNPALTEPLGIVVPFRAHPNDPPFDLLTPQGTLSGRLPVCAAVHDGPLLSAIAEAGALFVTFSVQDLTALRSVALPATLAAGLTGLHGDSWHDFCETYGLNHASAGPTSGPSAGSSSAATVIEGEGGVEAEEGAVVKGSISTTDAPAPLPSEPVNFVLVNWTPARLRRMGPEQLDGVRSHLRDLENYLGLQLDNIFVWTPMQTDVERITFCVARHSCDGVRRAILESMDGRLVPVTATEEDLNLPKDLPTVIRQLREAARSGNRRLQKRLWAEYQVQLDHELAEPLLRHALERIDPVERSRLFAIAGINNLVHPAAEMFLANFSARVAKHGIRNTDAVTAKEIEPLLKSYGLLLNLIKGRH
jgi:hypothetical protein